MFTVAAFYRFTAFPDPQALCGPLHSACLAAGCRGSILIAPEGINGTIAGPREGIDSVLDHVGRLEGCAGIEARESLSETMPFGRMKVRMKREIVSIGQSLDDPGAVGTHVDPAAWNALIADPQVAVIDTRNAYEIAIGSFPGAIDPGTERFRAFPGWWRASRDRFRGRRIAMFCTGGIRCEKASALLLREGVDEVLQLRGGILNYLDTVPPADSLWQGECFVFDRRVALGPGLVPGRSTLCHGCRRPLRPADRTRPEFEDGVSCHRCHATLDAARKARFRERQRQMRLATARTGRHPGAEDP